MIASALALMLMQPPPTLTWHARYGPLTQCLSGYAVTVGATEAVEVNEREVILSTTGGWLRVSLDSRDLHESFARGEAVESAELGRISRVSLPYRMRGRLDSDIAYLLAPVDGGPVIKVDSDRFNGSAHDLEVLSPLRRVRGETACGDFRAPAWLGDDPAAARWQSEARAGPAFYCRNGIGFSIGARDRTSRPWPRPDIEAGVRVASGDLALGVIGPEQSVHGSGRVLDAWPATVEFESDGPRLVLQPPHRPGQARTRREMDAAAAAVRSTISITFPVGQEAIARTFANRFIFVESTDPRCHGDPTAS